MLFFSRNFHISVFGSLVELNDFNQITLTSKTQQKIYMEILKICKLIVRYVIKAG